MSRLLFSAGGDFLCFRVVDKQFFGFGKAFSVLSQRFFKLRERFINFAHRFSCKADLFFLIAEPFVLIAQTILPYRNSTRSALPSRCPLWGLSCSVVLFPCRRAFGHTAVFWRFWGGWAVLVGLQHYPTQFPMFFEVLSTYSLKK